MHTYMRDAYIYAAGPDARHYTYRSHLPCEFSQVSGHVGGPITSRLLALPGTDSRHLHAETSAFHCTPFLLPFRQQIARTKDENRDNFREGILASFSIAYRISRLLGSDAREGCWPSQRERIRSDFWNKIDSMNDIDDRERRRGGFKKDKIDKRYR